MTPSTDKLAEIRKAIQNESFLEVTPSLAGIDPSLAEVTGGSIYYGTGLCTPRYLSVGLPFDSLGMVLVAERFRQIMNLDAVYHVIADTHAMSNDFCTPEEVVERARITRTTLEKMARNLDLAKFHFALSSEYDQSPRYLHWLEWVKNRSSQHEYVQRELADILWFRENRDLVLKLGWITQAGETRVGFDERLYDQEFRRITDLSMSFIYLKAGRTFDKDRPKASPYISIPGEHRILLQQGEPVKEKLETAEREFNDKNLGGARKHLINIVRLYERLYGKIEYDTPLGDKISQIIERVCR